MPNQQKGHLVYLAGGPETKEGDWTVGLRRQKKKGAIPPEKQKRGRGGTGLQEHRWEKPPEDSMPNPDPSTVKYRVSSGY